MKRLSKVFFLTLFLFLELLIAVTVTNAKKKPQPGDMLRRGYKAQTYFVVNSKVDAAETLRKGFEKEMPKTTVIPLAEIENNLPFLEKGKFNVIYLIDRSNQPELVKKYESLLHYPISYKYNELVLFIISHPKNKKLRMVGISAPNEDWLLKGIEMIKTWEKNEPNTIVRKNIKLINVFTSIESSYTKEYLSKGSIDTSILFHGTETTAQINEEGLNQEDIFIFIDRSNPMELPSPITKLLSDEVNTASPKRNEVILYKKERENAGPILYISAPTADTLKFKMNEYNEPDLFPSGIKNIELRDILIISNASEDMARKYLGAVYDGLYRFLPLETTDFKTIHVEEKEIVTVINRSKTLHYTNAVKGFSNLAYLKKPLKKFQGAMAKDDAAGTPVKIFISAPNQESLFEMFNKYPDSSSIPRKLQVVNFPYFVIVSNVHFNNNPYIPRLKGIVDYVNAANYKYNDGFNYADEVFLLTRDADIPNAVLSHLPKQMLNIQLSKNQAVAGSIHKDKFGKTAYFIIAPTAAKLHSLIGSYSTLDTFPSSPQKYNFADWRNIKKIFLAAQSDDNSNPVKQCRNTAMKKFKASMVNAGFSVTAAESDFNVEKLENLRNGDFNPKLVQKLNLQSFDAVVVMDMQDAEGGTEFYLAGKKRETPSPPPFTKSPPDKPEKPDPDEREYVYFGPRKYDLIDGSRENDIDYQKDMERYNKRLDEYNKKYRDWEDEKYEYESKIQNMQVVYTWDLLQKQTYSCGVSVNMYSLKNGGRLVTFSSKQSDKQEEKVKTVTAKTRGDDSVPDDPDVPESKEKFSASLVNNTVDNILSHFMEKLFDGDSIKPGEGTSFNWPPAATAKTNSDFNGKDKKKKIK